MNFVAGTVLAERYELLSRVEQNPTHDEHVRVWNGRDTLLDRPIRVHIVDDHISRRLTQARTAASVVHASTIRILSVEELDDSGIIITEAPQGLTLAEVYEAEPLDDMQARSLIGTVADVLDEVSRSGLHHQALDASSIFLTPTGIKIAGLGIDTGALAPEERTDQSRAQVDAISLLHLLYELLGEHTANDSAPDLAPSTALTMRQHDAIMLALREPERAVASAREVSHLLAPWPEFKIPEIVLKRAQPVAPVAAEPTGPLKRESVLRSPLPHTASAVPGTPPSAPPQRPSVLGRPNPAAPNAWTELTHTPPSFPPGTAPIAAAAPLVAAGGSTASPYPAAPARPAHPTPGPHGGQAAPQPARAQRGPTTAHAIAEPEKPLNLTPWIVTVFVILIIIALWWAVNYALTPKHHGSPAPSGQQTGGTSQTDPSPDATSPAATATTPPIGAVRPVIVSGKDLDPDGDGMEHPEAVDRAFDGDVKTYWYTEAYNDPTMGGKSGVGLLLNFRQASFFSSVTLNTNNSGGRVEVRATTAEDPAGGKLLTSGTLSEVTNLDLTVPAEADSVVLWFPELPQNNDGRNRVELNEVSFS